jgi:hypothetical protein
MAKTRDVGRASAALTRLSSRIPFGARDLAPIWRNDVQTYDPHTAGSGKAAETLILGDLYDYVQRGVSGGEFRVFGAGSTIYYVFNRGSVGTSPPSMPVALSPDSVRIQNNNNFPLLITIKEMGVNPGLTMRIGPKDTVPFDFGSNLGKTLIISGGKDENGRVVAPAFGAAGQQLFMPQGGRYNGALYVLTQFGDTFTVEGPKLI